MQHLTPVELLRFLEEEAATLQQINSKIANQLHCLLVEEELFDRELSNLEKDDAAVLAIEYGQSGQHVDEELFSRELPNVEPDEDPLGAVESGQSGQDLKEEPFNLQLSNLEKYDASDAIESGQSGHDLDEELFYPELSNVEDDKPSVLAVEAGQRGQDGRQETFNLQLSNVESDEAFVLGIVSGQSGQDLNNRLHIETNFQNEMECGALEMQSISLSASTAETLGSNPKPLQSLGTKKYADGDGQEVNEIIEVEKNQNIETDLQFKQGQEVLQVKEEFPLPRRSPRKRVSRRPARFRD